MVGNHSVPRHVALAPEALSHAGLLRRRRLFDHRFNWSYSDGNRAGYIQKFSHKGWLCKTHEGELAMTTVPGVAPVFWDFSSLG